MSSFRTLIYLFLFAVVGNTSLVGSAWAQEKPAKSETKASKTEKLATPEFLRVDKDGKKLKAFNNETYDIIYHEVRNTGIALIFIREFDKGEKRKKKGE